MARTPVTDTHRGPSARIKATCLMVVLLLGSVAVDTASAQYGRRRREPRFYSNPNTSAALKQWFPTATSIAQADGAPTHLTAYGPPAAAGGAPQVLGFAFWTTDLVPNEVGYHGAIKMLVGLTPAGRLTGVVVDSDTEPFGYFSVETPEFARQFAGKSILDRYRVGDDVDAVSRASISVGSATRAIRDSVRIMARALLNPADVK